MKERILLTLGRRNDMKIWNAPVGLLKTDESDAGVARVIKIGVAGQGDLMGLWAGREWKRPGRDTSMPRGVHFEIEVKTGAAELNKNQRRRRKHIVRVGGIYLVARSVEDVLSFFGPDIGGPDGHDNPAV